MAYPNPMPVSGPISHPSTIFTWWRDAIRNEDKEGGFEGFFVKKGQYLPAFPFVEILMGR
ncbi:hypothetical protein BFS30_01725 [Pedobacter steynii]|uniref:Uncharacterized protein n=1 Tax=Pedobacter steynii TaxID=430522 RepID=A0A1D7QBC7_9SPHI|nr:hypothetical protein BFS30_01725 [Pedobacter steynii]